MKPQPLGIQNEESHKVALYRRERKLSQAELAERCGLSRQFINLVEAGRTQPNVQVALRIAQVLECTVEALFGPDIDANNATVPVRLAEESLLEGSRLRLARVGSRWIGHAADSVLSIGAGFQHADGRLARTPSKTLAQVQVSTTELEQNIAIAGCDPALALLQGVEQGTVGRCFWVNCGSARALELLAGGCVHAAGLHYSGEDGLENLRQIERFEAGGRWRVLRFTRWEQGWMLRPGLQKKFRDTADLGSKELVLANREVGAGSRHWLDLQLASAGVSEKKIRGYDRELTSHWACARALTEGNADIAVGPRAVASAFGLDFIPVGEVSFDLVIPRHFMDHARIQVLLQRLKSRRFQKEIESLPGYRALEAGTVIDRAGT